MTMERIHRLCRHPLWRESIQSIEELERERIFCRHGTAHCLDVARLAWIENLERGLGLEKERIYAAALLHDIGRGLQLLEGVPHHQASASLAAAICASVMARFFALISARRAFLSMNIISFSLLLIVSQFCTRVKGKGGTCAEAALPPHVIARRRSRRGNPFFGGWSLSGLPARGTDCHGPCEASQ